MMNTDPPITPIVPPLSEPCADVTPPPATEVGVIAPGETVDAPIYQPKPPAA